MSADRWSMCPFCMKKNNIEYDTPEAKLWWDLHGKTLREDYENYTRGDGALVISYRRSCDLCGENTTFYFDSGVSIAVKKEEYESLLKDSDKLNRLERGGVDNWNGYGEAMTMDFSDD